MRILVVDDEPAVACLLANAIRRGGPHEAIAITSGAEALRRLEQSVPDAIFLDVAMPDMSGVEVLRQIRAKYPNLHVLLITGHAGAKEIEDAQSLGVSGILEKPFILGGLSGTLKALADI